MIEPLALAGNYHVPSYTNLSRSFSLSILDENEKNIEIKTNFTNPIEFFIPRDPNLILPSMFFQNVTSINNTNLLLFHFHALNLTQTNPNLTFSIHLEIHPLDTNLSYLLIYKFDDKPQLNSFDGSKLFCPSSSFVFLNLI
jgi:hypothetical protein